MRKLATRTGVSALIFVTLTAIAAGDDWPQWRGPSRSGVAAGGKALPAAWPKAGPTKLWESEKIPSHAQGGFSSVVVADGRSYIYVNWKFRVPFDTRTLTTAGLTQLGWSKKELPKDLADAVEKDRLSEKRAKLKGKELNAWSDMWVKERLTPEQQKSLGGYFRNRLRRGKSAIALELLDRLATIKDKAFATQADLDKWLVGNAIPDDVKKKVIGKIRTYDQKAKDAVLCFGPDGKTLWKKEYPGRATEWGSSSTPCVADGRVYAAGTNSRVYCFDAKTGREIWVAKTPANAGHEINSSIVKLSKAVIVMCQPMIALNAETGKVLWTQNAVSTRNASPTLWPFGGKTYLLCNGAAGNKIACVDSTDGNVVWTTPGGGSSSVAVADDHMVVLTDKKKLGTTAYKISSGGAEKLWTAPYWDGGASPLIYKGYVYVVVGANKGRAACIDLKTGKVAWDEEIGGTEFSSPVGADGKVIAVTKNGGLIVLLQATPDKYTVLTQARLPIAQCTSPALAGGKMYLRLKNAVACYDLVNPGKDPEPADAKNPKK